MNIEKLSEEELKDIKKSFTVFMMKVVKHHSLNFIKKEKLNNSRNLPLDEGSIYKVSLSIYDNGIFFVENDVNDDDLEKIMTKTEHRKAISKLSRREKQILKALYIDEENIEDVAKKYNITTKTILNTGRKAINKLRNDMEE